MSGIFASNSAEASFRRHVSQAAPFVRFGVGTALVLRRVFGPNASRIPVVKVACGPLESLVAMHNAAPENAHAEAAPKSTKCELDSAILGRTWDLCVVGSGPGGAVTAAMAAARGESVVIIEAGGPVDESVEHHSVAQMMSDFGYGGQELVIGPSPVPYAQGRAWGGGSEVNSGLYHHMPRAVASRWAQSTGLTAEELDSAVREVEETLPIHTQPASSLGCYADSPIKAIKGALGWEGGVIPRWRKYDRNGFTHFGMASTYLDKALGQGAGRVMHHRVDFIDVTLGGVTVHLVGDSCSHQISASSACLSAGVVGTPEILMRSRLAQPRDFGFKFHAMIREVAEYERVVNDLADIDPHQTWSEDNQFKIGAAVSTPELLAATMAQKGLPLPSNPENCAALYISFASEGKEGLFKLGSHLYPYFLPSKSMKATAQTAGTILRDGIAATGGRVMGEKKNGYSTVHVFGSLPLGSSKVVDQLGVVRGTEGRVFVRDASILPSHPLVNPQGPLMHLVTAVEHKRTGSQK